MSRTPLDWPVIASLAGVAVLAAAVLGIGTYAALRSEPPVEKAPAAPVLIAVGPSQLPTSPEATPPYSGPATAPLSPLTAQDVEHYATVRPEVRVEPAPRLDLGPSHDSARKKPSRKKPPTASPPAKKRPGAHRPPTVAKPSRKKPAAAPRADPRYHRVMTAAKISRLRRALRLRPDQAAHWRRVAFVLREIGRAQIAQIKRGGKPEVERGIMMRLYYAAQPLLSTLEPAQKERVRAMARLLGYGHVASML